MLPHLKPYKYVSYAKPKHIAQLLQASYRLKMASRALLRELHDGTDRWKINVRVIRRWNVFSKANPSMLFSISMVLLDSEVITFLFGEIGIISLVYSTIIMSC